MRQSLEQIEQLLAAELQAMAAESVPRTGVAMLELEERQQARGRRMADLAVARGLVEAHLDAQLRTQSIEAARELLAERGAKQVRICGWRATRVRLRGGLKMRMSSPYVRPELRGRRGRRRTKRAAGGAGLYPLLWHLGFEDTFSPAARSEIGRAVVLGGSYSEAREQLERAGLPLHTQSMVRAAVELGSKGLELREQSLGAARKKPLPESSSLSGKVVRISLDGGRARPRTTQRGPGVRPGHNGRRPFELDWREPRVLTIDVLGEDAERKRGEPILYEVTLGDAAQTMELLVGTLRLLGVCHARLVLFVSDGAAWIWNRIASALDEAGVAPERRRLVLDYFHATEHISEALAACKSLASTQRATLFDELRRTLLEPSGAQAVIERLATFARGRRGRAVSTQIAYLTGHLRTCVTSNFAPRTFPSAPVSSRAPCGASTICASRLLRCAGEQIISNRSSTCARSSRPGTGTCSFAPSSSAATGSKPFTTQPPPPLPSACPHDSPHPLSANAPGRTQCGLVARNVGSVADQCGSENVPCSQIIWVRPVSILGFAVRCSQVATATGSAPTHTKPLGAPIHRAVAVCSNPDA